MSFNGSLLTVGGTILPLKYVYTSSYTITPNQRFDLDSYRNANGVLVRNALDHTSSDIKISTVPMTNRELPSLMSIITGAFQSYNERRVSLTYYCPDLDSYKTGTFYIPDIEFPIKSVDTANKVITYDSFDIEFIEY